MTHSVDDLAKSCHTERNIFIVLYADHILLIARSVCELDALLNICERELIQSDITIKIILLFSKCYLCQSRLHRVRRSGFATNQ